MNREGGGGGGGEGGGEKGDRVSFYWCMREREEGKGIMWSAC